MKNITSFGTPQIKSNYFIDKQLSNNILNWVLNNEDLIKKEQNHFHEGLIYGRINMENNTEFIDFPNNDLRLLEEKIKNFFNLPLDTITEPDFGIVLMYAPGGDNGYRCIPHTDRNANDLIHTKFNVMLSKPEIGGNPIIEDEVIDVEENEVWICVAGLKTHSTVKMEGMKPRVMFSFGYLLPKEFLLNNNWI